MNIGIYSLEKNVIVKKTYIEINYNAKENRCLYQILTLYTMYNQENH